MRAKFRFLLALTFIGVVLLIGTVGFRVIEGVSWFDSFYMVVITMTAVGYGHVWPLSDAGRVFNVFFLAAAVTALFILLTTFAHTMLEFELGRALGRRRMAKEISKLRSHVIICGAGRVGRTVAREFVESGIPVVIIELDADRAAWAVNENIPVLIGAGTTEETLAEARIDTARGLVAAVTSDPDNLYIILTARGMREDLRIIARASEEDAIAKFKRAGADEVVSPYHFVGQRIAQLFLHPHVMSFMDTTFLNSEIDLKIEEVEVKSDSALAGNTLAGCRIRQETGVMVLALRKAAGQFEFDPQPDARIESGDFLIVAGASEHLSKLDRMLQA